MGTNLTPFLVILLTTLVNTESPLFTSTSICPPYYSGSVEGNSCSQEYFTCINGIEEAARCNEGFVFFQTECVAVQDSPECTVGNNDEGQSEEANDGELYDEVIRTDEPTETSPSADETTTSTSSSYTLSIAQDNGETTTVVPSAVEETIALTTEPTTTTTIEPTTTTTIEPTTTTTTEIIYTNGGSTSGPYNNGEVEADTLQICQEGQISTFGQCSSHFTKCQGNTVRTKQCPASTLFEAALLLCVYDLPQCQPVVSVPVQIRQEDDIVVSPFDNDSDLHRRRNNYVAPETIRDNPFFTPEHYYRPPVVHRRNQNTGNRHHKKRYENENVVFSPFSTSTRGRAILADSFSGYRRSRMDRIPYGENRRPEGRRSFNVNDQFDGKNAHFIGSNIEQLFPRVHSNRRLGPREYPDDYQDASGFEPSDLFGATNRRKRQASYYGPSGTNPSNNEVSSRQALVKANCKSINRPTFLNFGDCLQQFIYCSGTGVNRLAACPIGESFDVRANTCVEICGVSSTTSEPVLTSTIHSPSDSTTSKQEDEISSYSEVSTTEYTVATTSSAYGDVIIESTTSTPIIDENQSTSAPNDDVSQETTEVPPGYRCHGFSDNLISLGCSQEYLHCASGVAIPRICPAALYFDELRSLCDYRENVAECVGIQEQDSPVTTLATYTPPSEQLSEESSDRCFGVSDGPLSTGCSASYVFCSNGKVAKNLTCPLGQGFDQSTNLCQKFEDIPAWACDSAETTTDSGLGQSLPYVSLESVLTSTTETPSDSTESEQDDEISSTSVVSTTENTVVTTSSAFDVVVEKGCQPASRASLGFCSSVYLECIASQNRYVEQSCETGQLFDIHSNACVVNTECGKDTIRRLVNNAISTTPATYRNNDRRCASAADNSTKSIGNCRTSYIRCSYGQAIIESCAPHQVFCKKQLACVHRDSIAECRPSFNPPVKSQINDPPSRGEGFCDGKPDGLFRNPGDCSGILRCFGGELFDYPSCPAQLAFNEGNRKCDYPQNVRGCAAESDDQGECQEHGAFIANTEDCSVFYRCVWGSKVSMKCPSGTVFNPSLSVCDWPSAVPSCGASNNDVPSDSGYY